MSLRIDDRLLDQHSLKRDEYDRIVSLLGREPNLTELGLFSVMWSEHCSYKSSKLHLRGLPTQGPRVLQGPGENAGAVDIGDGLAVVFKIESHTHPSFIEPYQGAATGVGGILRDIFTMGARPVATLNSLRFGPLEEPRNRRLLAGVVAGIGGYGNSFGCPTLGGEVAFEPCYSGNPLVNAMCVGLVRADRIFKGRAEGVGNTVFYVGAKTGRDGIHGATMASAEFGEKSEEKRPTVQVGDPFMEKVLLEACLEAMKTGAIVGIQDMGAAGLTCSTSEMGARAGTGIEIDVAKVPMRETGMSAYEVMLSESQERMLLVAARGREREVVDVFEKWDLHAEAIGRVIAERRLRVWNGAVLEADVPNEGLTDDAPLYDRPWIEPRNPAADEDVSALPPPPDPGETLLRLLATPAIANKRWIYRQYDSTVRTNTMVGPASDAGVIRVKGTAKALALAADCNGRYCWLDPYAGAQLAVAEACRNVAAAGALPIGATNCLNFGSPEKPEVMGQLVMAIRGMGDACRALDVPITGGNVSLYNETDGRAIYPTPVIGVVGLIEDASRALSSWFKAPGDSVYLLGVTGEDMGGSEYLKAIHDRVAGRPPKLDLAAEKRLHALMAEAAAAGALRSAHDPSDGGLAVALAECCFVREDVGPGALLELPPGPKPEVLLFSESPSRMVVTTRDGAALEVLALRHGVPCARLGDVGGERLTLRQSSRVLVDLEVSRLNEAWTSLERMLGT
ncbi:MAG TPA: phosphoribosylformylglycinamidine synthase subunit PurL [Vicinamibacteria bacterium]|nr:phosphoribosylformylglycinamidine synthase subunit PurL [Vicinamibacteria bacterium]